MTIESERKKLVLKKKASNRIELILRGEDHTMANLIVKLAIRKPHVTYAAYRIDHPLVGEPIVIIATDGKRDPLDVLKEVMMDIVKLSDEFLKKFEATAGQH